MRSLRKSFAYDTSLILPVLGFPGLGSHRFRAAKIHPVAAGGIDERLAEPLVIMGRTASTQAIRP